MKGVRAAILELDEASDKSDCSLDSGDVVGVPDGERSGSSLD